MRNIGYLVLVLLIVTNIFASDLQFRKECVEVTSSTPNQISLDFKLSGLELQKARIDDSEYAKFTFNGEGVPEERDPPFNQACC
jgi:hypothetical protein